jgi:hypothetical protein
MAKQDSVEVFSQRIAVDILEQLRDLYSKGDFKSWSEFFGILLERYSNPLRINSENERKVNELQDEILLKTQKIIEWEDLYKNLNLEHNSLIEEIVKLKNYQTTLQSNISTSNDQLDKVNRELSSRLQIDPLNMKLLQFVADREGKKRNQEWTPSDVVNCFIDFRFIRGTVNGGFDSVPDEVVKKLKEEE